MLFKKLVLAACAFGSLTSAHAGGGAKPFLIISDIDDTIKITNVLDKDKAVENGLFGDRTFLGMAELYQELASNGGMKAAPVVYMSGSPPILLGEIRKMLVGGHKFPDGNFRLRDWLKTKDVYSFKSAGMLALHAIFAKSKTVFVELGDDTERDMDVYHDYIKAHPGKTAAAYIHVVTGKKLPEYVIPYYTAFDVALMELEAGRLREAQVERVGEVLLKGDFKDLFPRFVLCPEDLEYGATPLVSKSDALMKLKDQVAAKIVHYCRARNHAPDFGPIDLKVSPAGAEAIKSNLRRNDERLIRDVENEVP